jgi:hypothetical protein
LRVFRKFLTVSPVALVVALIGGYALASIPDSSGVFHGCYKVSGGALRLIDSGKTCTSRERPVTWNQQGPPGINGTDGTSVVARLRWAGDVLASGQTLLVGSWTQGATEVDEMVFGTATFASDPQGCSSAAIRVDAYVPNNLDQRGQAVHWSLNISTDTTFGPGTVTYPFGNDVDISPRTMFEPGATTDRSLYARVAGGGPSCPRLVALAFDVEGAE